MKTVDLIKGLLALLPRCNDCKNPASYATDTAEIGYRLYWCDDHKKALNAGYSDMNQPYELKSASLVREARKLVFKYHEQKTK